MEHYNWQEIFKSKTNSELFDIYSGKKNLSEEAKEFAGKELENRNFDFNNIEREKEKMELEILLEEEKFYSRQFGMMASPPMQFITIITIAIFLIIITLQYYLNGQQEHSPSFLFVTIAIFTYFVYRYKRAKRQTKKRQSRINEIIRKL